MPEHGLYIILDTAHGDYSTYLDDLGVAASGAAVANFAPRLSLDSSKALVQLKDSAVSDGMAWLDSASACVISSGTEAWAHAEMWAAWTASSGNAWHAAS